MWNLIQRLLLVALFYKDARGCDPFINAAGMELIKEFEGFSANPTPDSKGMPDVGYGHKCQTKACKDVSFPFPLTTNQGERLLENDIVRYTSCLNRALKSNTVTLNENQWAALISWTYNVGCAVIKSSSLTKRLNGGEDPNKVATQELPQWNKGGGKVLPGLVKRRAAEIKLFQTPSGLKVFPC